MKLLIIWAAISVVAFIETIAMKITITKHFKQRYGKSPTHKSTASDYMISLIKCMVPLYHIYLILAYTFAGSDIEARSIFMLVVAEALGNEDDKE